MGNNSLGSRIRYQLINDQLSGQSVTQGVTVAAVTCSHRLSRVRAYENS